MEQRQKKYSSYVLKAVLFFLMLAPLVTIAADYTPMEEIPGFGRPSDFPTYILSFFKFGIWIAGISAMLMIMIGGYVYMASAGNNARMEKGKGIITDAILGLILALFSWLLLYTINPGLVNITTFDDSVNIADIKKIGSDIRIKKSIERQKKSLVDISGASNLNEVTGSIGSYDNPKDNEKDKRKLAPTSWYFSQKNPRWGNETIGNSDTLMRNYGCAVTSLSMVFRAHGIDTDPGEMCKEDIFSYDLIQWPSSWKGLQLVSSKSHGNINWSTIDEQLDKGNPVIVYIRKTNGRGGHYVVITGKDDKDYVVHDPYFGSNLYLETSKSLVGKIGIDSGVVVDQMIIYN